MKKKKTIIFLITLVLLIGGIFLVNNIYQNKNKLNKTKRKRQNNLAIMIKEENASDYAKSSSNDIPIGNYILNEDKTHCENNGKILSYDNTTGKVKFSFVGSDRCYLYFDYHLETIKLGNNELIVNSGTPDFSQKPTTNEGIFKADDDLGTSYYFRGAVDNNWVKFGTIDDGKCYYNNQKNYYQEVYSYDSEEYVDNKDDCLATPICITEDDEYYVGTDEEICKEDYNGTYLSNTYAEWGKSIYWRIVRINGDGSIRMIYSNLQSNNMAGINGNEVYQFNSYTDGNGKAEYVGYQYIEGQQHGYGKCDGSNASCGNVYNSVAKQEIDKWFKTTSLYTTDFSKLADAIYCNDRSASLEYVGPYGEINNWVSTETYYYSSFYFLGTIPSLKCGTTSDKFTVNDNIGNGALSYPIGLLTIYEARMAGWESNNFLTSKYFWTMSPISSYSGALNSGSIVSVSYHSYLNPVISLSSSVKLSGDGTWENPYIVVD